jgi:hypothetical protein
VTSLVSYRTSNGTADLAFSPKVFDVDLASARVKPQRSEKHVEGLSPIKGDGISRTI